MFPSFILLVAAFIASAQSQGEKAKVEILEQGNCPYGYLNQTHGIRPGDYNLRVNFNAVNVTFIPAEPTVPGCFVVRVTGVQVLPNLKRSLKDKPLKDISAEYDLRIGGSPNTERGSRKMSCGETKQASDCPCESEDACMVCGFCKNLQKNGNDLVFNQDGAKKTEVLGKKSDQCGCDEAFEPGTYTLESEICTPSKEALLGEMTNDEVEIIANEKRISMWASINIYDEQVGFGLAYLNYVNKLPVDIRKDFSAAMKKRKNTHLVGCFMLGYNVEFNV